MKKFLLFALSLFALSANAKVQPILIQGAMDLETKVLIEALEKPVKKTLGAWSFWAGSIDSYPVVISRTEIGIANASAATTLGIEKFNPLYIINQGTSGGHDPALKRGDIVVGKSSLNMGAYKVKFREKGAGIAPTEWENFAIVMRLRENEDFVEHQSFAGDPALVKAFTAEAPNYKAGKVVEGVIGTADEWNREVDRLNWFHKTLGTSAEEMETSAAALVAKAYKVPFIGVRVLSNTDQHKQDFEPQTAIDCQNFVLSTVKKLIKEKVLYQSH